LTTHIILRYNKNVNKVIRNNINAIHKYKTIPTTKVLLEKMGFAVGNATFPMKRYSEEEKARIVADMKKAGLELN